MMRRDSTEVMKDLLSVLIFVFVVLFFIFIVINTFFVNPVTFGISLDGKSFTRGENVTLSSTVRNLGFFRINDVLIESYVVELDDNGGIFNNSREKKNLMYLENVRGLSSKMVYHNFGTEDLDSGDYRVFTHFSYYDKTKILSEDFKIK